MSTSGKITTDGLSTTTETLNNDITTNMLPLTMETTNGNITTNVLSITTETTDKDITANVISTSTTMGMTNEDNTSKQGTTQSLLSDNHASSILPSGAPTGK